LSQAANRARCHYSQSSAMPLLQVHSPMLATVCRKTIGVVCCKGKPPQLQSQPADVCCKTYPRCYKGTLQLAVDVANPHHQSCEAYC
jgi:hypothetical protein